MKKLDLSAAGPAEANAPVTNYLLAKLPSDLWLQLRPGFERVELKIDDRLIMPEQTITHVYFLESGIASVIVRGDNRCSEIGLIGREGLVGAPAILDVDCAPHEVRMQLAGWGWRVASERLRKAAADNETLCSFLLRFVQVFLVQTGSTAFSNAGYTVEQRLARWLLMYHDRIDSDDIFVTHDFLAIMLGVRRPSVTLALQLLEGSQAIKSMRGHVLIRDRSALEAIASAAYGMPESEYARLIGIELSRRTAIENQSASPAV
jgi:CRP-like cAMP-binding protein